MSSSGENTDRSIMAIEHIDDWEMRLARQDAFWQREIIDRPVVHIEVPAQPPRHPWPRERTYPCIRDRWLDTERCVEHAVARVRNTCYLGDALPHIWPNLGPELFSAFFGCEMEFSDDTTWAIPAVLDWAEADRFRFSTDNFYWRKLEEMTDALLEAGRGLFYTGISDIHTGGDAVAAFRDPQRLNMDLLLAPEDVKRLLARVNEAFKFVLDYYFDKLLGARQAISSWMGIVSTRKWLIPSNDFSCMISKEMFDEFFLEGIAGECRHLEASVYHLDGPDALRHLDSLLAIEELNAVQWVYGAGNGRASDWIPVYRRIQAAGKGIQLGAEPDELDVLIENLRPEGVWMSVGGLDGPEAAQAVIDKISQWR